MHATYMSSLNIKHILGIVQHVQKKQRKIKILSVRSACFASRASQTEDSSYLVKWLQKLGAPPSDGPSYNLYPFDVCLSPGFVSSQRTVIVTNPRVRTRRSVVLVLGIYFH